MMAMTRVMTSDSREESLNTMPPMTARRAARTTKFRKGNAQIFTGRPSG
jgi:hypothetical protein